MSSPWLLIPLSDYEQHMNLPTVGQAQMLSGELASAVATHRPRSLAVIGCAGGNGFHRLTSPFLERVIGVDINPDFIQVTRARYGTTIQGLELCVADIEAGLSAVAPVDLVFAGLILEYVDVARAMRVMHELCNDHGSLVIVLQQPNAVVPAVSPSRYTSLRSLNHSTQLHDPFVVAQTGESVGLKTESTHTLVLPSGKQFAVLTLRRSRNRG